jgi:uncharacterized protein (TIGR03790 family)
MLATCRTACLAAVALGLAIPVTAQTGQNVLVVGNALSKPSDEIAQHYMRKRNVPGEQVIRLNVPIEEEVPRAVYEARIELPIAAWLRAHTAQDRILYIVLTKDVPLRITGTGGQTGTVASVDSELALLYRRLWGGTVPLAGSTPNPYFAGSSELKDAKPFSHRTHDMYLVTRLDGFTVDDVKALIDRGAEPSRQGVIVLDGRSEVGPASAGNKWLTDAAAALRKLPDWDDRIVFDASKDVLKDVDKVLGYYSWGSNDRTPGTRRLNHRFEPGALGGQFVSTDARTFHEPPASWTVNGRPFRGSHQSLIGDLIREGITGVAGHVAEPYLNATARPDILFAAYVAGFNLAESFYMAMPSLSWQTVVIGDPLCAPFGPKPLAPADLSPPKDSVTELPEFLSARRVSVLSKGGVKPDAVKLMIKAEARVADRDRAGAQAALEQATAADPAYVAAHVALAMLYESAGEFDAAIDRYRWIVERHPNEATALNNLAYALAIRKNAPADALPIAKRAFTQGKGTPESADTLAWVHHLMGNDQEARPLIAFAATRLPGVADVRWHAAAILAALGEVKGAKLELEAALRLEGRLADNPDVQELKKKLGIDK